MFRWRTAVYHGLAFGSALVLLLPLYWAIVASLGVNNAPPPPSVQWWPANPQWQNYARVFELIPLQRYLYNSLVVLFWAVPLTLVVTSLAGLAMIQLPFGQQQWAVGISIAWLIIPNTAVWIYRFQIYKWLGLLNSPSALFAPAVAGTTPLYVLLYYWSLQRVPYELLEAARLDTSEQWRIWWYVALPLIKPTTVVVALLTAILYWGDFTSPTLYLTDPATYTAPVGLQALLQMDRTNWPILMAAAVILFAPVLLLFIFLQHFFWRNAVTNPTTQNG